MSGSGATQSVDDLPVPYAGIIRFRLCGYLLRRSSTDEPTPTASYIEVYP
jgi:hypothetical protein